MNVMFHCCPPKSYSRIQICVYKFNKKNSFVSILFCFLDCFMLNAFFYFNALLLLHVVPAHML